MSPMMVLMKRQFRHVDPNMAKEEHLLAQMNTDRGTSHKGTRISTAKCRQQAMGKELSGI